MLKTWTVAGLIVVALGTAAPAHAAARVFVSVTGTDSGDCSNAAAPCRTFNFAIAAVDTGGEVIVLTSGSYAGATITKSVKLNTPAGVVAFSASPIVVNGAGISVVIRGVTVKALVPGTGNGIEIQDAGVVQIENCVVDGWDRGIYLTAPNTHVSVVDTNVRFSGTAAVHFNGASSRGVLSNVRMISTSSLSLYVLSGKVTMDHSVSALATYGVYVEGSGSELNVTDSVLHGNISNGADMGGILRVSGNTITDHTSVGLFNVGSGAIIETFGNNVLRGNAMDTVGTITPVTLQ